MTKAMLENGVRDEVLTAIAKFLEQTFDTDVLRTGSGELAIPRVDAEGNEKFALIKVSIPRGTRVDGTYKDYDGYAAAEDYRLEQEEKANKRKKKTAEPAE